VEAGAHLSLRGLFTQQHDVLRQLVQLVSAFVQIRCSTAQRLLRDGLDARWCDEGVDRSLDHVLIQPAPLVQLSKRRLHVVSQGPSLCLGEAVHIDAAQLVDDADVTRLRHERAAVDEAPQRQERVHAARLAVVTQDARDPHHRTTSTSNRSCFPGS
jgi:hypothetical protein